MATLLPAAGDWLWATVVPVVAALETPVIFKYRLYWARVLVACSAVIPVRSGTVTWVSGFSSPR